jgi:hypothetical protein
MLSEMLVTPMA